MAFDKTYTKLVIGVIGKIFGGKNCHVLVGITISDKNFLKFG